MWCGSVRSMLERSDQLVIESVKTTSSNARVQAETTPTHRIEKLLRILCHPLKKLSTVENDQLKKLMEFRVFALDDTELGCTKLVEHTILDTMHLFTSSPTTLQL